MISPQHRESRRARRADNIARGLGWFSIGLGLAELLAPRAVARATGLRGREGMLQLYGLREIATGVGLLTAKRRAPWLWARAGGDLLDIATLQAARPADARSAVALAAVAGVTAVDLMCARTLHAEERRAHTLRRDYSDRRGFPLPPQEMRGAALVDFEAPADMRVPQAMRPYAVA